VFPPNMLQQVRPDCIAGMRCLLGMVQGYSSSSRSVNAASSSSNSNPAPAAGKGRGQGSTAAVSATHLHQQTQKPSAGVVLMRQLDQYHLFPTATQLHLIDKKFGGEIGSNSLTWLSPEARIATVHGCKAPTATAQYPSWSSFPARMSLHINNSRHSVDCGLS